MSMAINFTNNDEILHDKLADPLSLTCSKSEFTADLGIEISHSVLTKSFFFAERRNLII